MGLNSFQVKSDSPNECALRDQETETMNNEIREISQNLEETNVSDEQSVGEYIDEASLEARRAIVHSDCWCCEEIREHRGGEATGLVNGADSNHTNVPGAINGESWPITETQVYPEGFW